MAGTWPFYAPDEIEAATRTLASGRVNYWTGEETKLFEQEFAAYHDMPHAIALGNGTLALQAALLALDIQPGDEVVVPPRTFMATAAAVVLHGARPVFADIDPDGGGLTAAAIEAVLTRKTRAVIPVHLGGWPCDMGPIVDLADSRGLRVIEDCAQSHGAVYHGRLTGTIGHVNAFSFCQDKIISTGGEGGMLLTTDDAAWRKAWSYKDHGKDWDAVHSQTHPPGFRWLHHSFGTNWRMTEFQSAIGRVQLRKLDDWVAARRANAAVLAAALGGLPAVRVPQPAAGVEPSYYRFYAYVRPEGLREGWSRDRILEQFAARGIPSFSGSCSEIYREQAFARAGLEPAAPLPVAKELGDTSIAFPVHPTLDGETVAHWGEVARAVLQEAGC